MTEPRFTGADQSENFWAWAEGIPATMMEIARIRNSLKLERVVLFFVNIFFLLFVFATRQSKRAVCHGFVKRNQSSTDCFAALFNFSLRAKRRTFGIKS